MNKPPRLVMTLGLVLVSMPLVASAAGGPPPPRIEDAIRTAKGTNKPLVVEFGTTWCKPCRIFEEEVLPRPEVQTSLENVTFVRYDAEEAPGLQAAARYGVTSYPTFLAIDGEGTVRGKKSGFPGGAAGAHDFLAFVDEARRVVAEEAVIRADLAKKPADAEVQLAAARWYAARGRTPEALGCFDKVLALPSATPAARGEAASTSASLRRAAAWRKQLLAEKLELLRKYPRIPGRQRALALVAGEGSVPVAELETLYAAEVAATSSAGDLNELIYSALAARAKDAALAGATKLHALAPRDADLIDTVAEVHHARGERDRALKIADEAIALAKNERDAAALRANRERFASTTEESHAVVGERTRSEAMWARLAKIDSDDAASGPRGPMPPQMMEMIAFSGAVRKLDTTVGAACAAKAGKLGEAWVRLKLAPEGGAPLEVTILEPGVKGPLAACLKQALRGASLPKAPAMSKGREVFAVTFTRPTT